MSGLFRHGEYPWAIVQLWELMAESATAAGAPDVAADAWARARHALITHNAGR